MRGRQERTKARGFGAVPTGAWLRRPLFEQPGGRAFVPVATVLLMAGLFSVDVLLRPPVSVGVLYGFAVYTTASAGRLTWVLGTSLTGVALTVLAFATGHGAYPYDDALFRCVYGIVLQVLIAILVVRALLTSRQLRNQANLLDHTHDSVVLRRVDGQLLFWNRGATLLFGWTAEEARQLTQAELIGTGARLPPMPLEEFYEHGTWQGEIEVVAKDGRRMAVHCHCTLLLDDRKRPFAVLTTGSDVTERLQAEESLRRNERRYRTIFQSAGVGIWEFDLSYIKDMLDEIQASGICDLRAYFAAHPEIVRTALNMVIMLDVNDAGVQLFEGRSKEELVGSFGRFWPVDSEPTFAEAMLGARAGLNTTQVEVTLQTARGRRFDCIMTTVFTPESASRKSVWVTFTDISTMTSEELALRKAQADLAHASRLTSLGELAASIAHEVRQPVAGALAAAQGGLRWLKRDVPSLADVERSLDRVVSEAKRASAVIVGVRALAQNVAPKFERFDVHQLVEETLQLVGDELSRNGVAVTRAPAGDPISLCAERVQIQQVLINLMLNAVQAMAAVDGGERRVILAASASASDALISVEDTGPGIALEMRERLFTAFNSSRADGMGLGLSICATIVRRHEGRIWLDDSLTRGTRFVFSIPLEGGDAAGATRADPQRSENRT